MSKEIITKVVIGVAAVVVTGLTAVGGKKVHDKKKAKKEAEVTPEEVVEAPEEAK